MLPLAAVVKVIPPTNRKSPNVRCGAECLPRAFRHVQGVMLPSRSLLVACILVCFTVSGVRGESAISPIPHFEKTTCAGALSQDDKAECGILSVPENRSREKSRVIHLPVVILHSRAPGAPRDAVLFMTGGPGLSSVSHAPTSRDVIFTEDRDYVVLEQRGAHHADPALTCPEVAAPKSEIAAGCLKGAPAVQALATAAYTCRNRLVTEGADLAGYTSAGQDRGH